MKYKTLAEVKTARERGDVDGTLVVDNDDTALYSDGECVFRAHPEELLEQALDLLGIPHEAA